jgi:lysophospholipase L1-like esterase
LAGACSEADSPPANTAGTANTTNAAGAAGNTGLAGGGGVGGVGNAGSAGAGGADAGAAGRGGPGDGDAGGAPAASLVPGQVNIPNPIISRGAAVFSSAGGSTAVNDGRYHAGGWYLQTVSADAPPWVALQLGAGPTRLLFSWDDGGTYNYQDAPGTTVYGLPGAYRIEVSADSTNGADGTWDEVVNVTDNTLRTRAHAIDFSGNSWVKMLIVSAPPTANGGAVSIGEIDVHDISQSGSGLPEDTWFFMGDSITAFAYDRAEAHQPSFAAGINAASPAFYPAMINGGIGGETTDGALARVDASLANNPLYRFFVLGYGTNDAANEQVPVVDFKANMQTLIDRVRAAGREPILPYIPPAADGAHASIPAYNIAIGELTAENGLLPGADLYAFFTSTEGLFTCPPCGTDRMTDNLHPNDTGLAGINAQWSAAMRGVYPE